MQIVDQKLRLRVEKSLVMRDRLDVGPKGLVVVEIADVMAQERMASPAQGEGRLQLAAEGEDRSAGTRSAGGAAVARRPASARIGSSPPATIRVTESSQRR